MTSINLDTFLYARRELITLADLAERIGMRRNALEKMLDDGLFADPAPNRTLTGNYFATRTMAKSFWSWIRNHASEAEIERVASFVRDSDPKHLDYEVQQENESTRRWLLTELTRLTPDKWLRGV